MLVPKLNHAWDLDEAAAICLQSELARQVVVEDRLPSTVHFVCGVDVAYDTTSNQLIAAAVVLEADSREIHETATARGVSQFPYKRGLFSFRELPPLCQALSRLAVTPDLIVCDGHGLAHPRRFGLACHLGVLYDIPTIGCGKTWLIGEFAELSRQRGAMVDLVDHGEVIGRAVRTQDDVRPVFVSVGHRISLDLACHWVLRLAPKYRLPETTRQANRCVNILRAST